MHVGLQTRSSLDIILVLTFVLSTVGAFAPPLHAQAPQIPVAGHIQSLPPGLLYGDNLVVDAFFESEQPVRIVARTVTFAPSAGIRAPQIDILASAITGGRLDASGTPGADPGADGNNGGTISVVAATVTALTIDVSGGAGAPGQPGQPGSAGRRARCGRACDGGHNRAGRGGRGHPGGDGGDGGDGGTIRLVGPWHENIDVGGYDGGAAAVAFGGGLGGPSGPGGAGGPGGGGCSACPVPFCDCDWDGKSGAANGSSGPDGQPGMDGSEGALHRVPMGDPRALAERISAALRDAAAGLVR